MVRVPYTTSSRMTTSPRKAGSHTKGIDTDAIYSKVQPQVEGAGKVKVGNLGAGAGVGVGGAGEADNKEDKVIADTNMCPKSRSSFAQTSKPEVEVGLETGTLGVPHGEEVDERQKIRAGIETRPFMGTFRPIIEKKNLDIEGTPLPPSYPGSLMKVDWSKLRIRMESLNEFEQQKIEGRIITTRLRNWRSRQVKMDRLIYYTKKMV